MNLLQKLTAQFTKLKRIKPENEIDYEIIIVSLMELISIIFPQ